VYVTPNNYVIKHKLSNLALNFLVKTNGCRPHHLAAKSKGLAKHLDQFLVEHQIGKWR